MVTELSTLGECIARRDGKKLELSPDGGEFLLLAYLALEGPVAPSRLRALLWPDVPGDEAEVRLTETLQRLRERVGSEAVQTSEEGLELAPDAVELDVTRMREAAASGRPWDVLSIYRGPFLEHAAVPVSGELAEWVRGVRRELASEAAVARQQVGWARPEGEGDLWDRVLHEVRTRKTLHTALLYAGFAWGSLELCNLLVERALLSDAAFFALLAFHVVGLPLAVGAVWLLDRGDAEEYPRGRSGLLRRVGVRPAHLMVAVGVLTLGSAGGWLVLQQEDSSGVEAAWAGLPDEKHIAVLPFRFRPDAASGTQEEGEFGHALADGLMETVANRLSQLEGLTGRLWVVPPAELRSRGVTTPSEAQREFGVTLAVGGSVRPMGDSLFLTLNLIDAGELRQLRSVEVAGSRAELSRMDPRLTGALRSLLELDLAPEQRSLLASSSTGDPRAFDFFQQGRGYLQRFEREEAVDLAIDLFERALERDPDYVLAWAGLGEAYLRKYELSQDPAHVERGQEAVEEALALDDEVAAAHLTLGMIQTATGHYEDAVDAFGRVLALEPHSAEARLGMARAYEEQGRVPDAEANYLRAVELRPGFWGGHNELGRFYSSLGRYEQALEQFERVVALTPDNDRGWSNLGAVAWYMGRMERAREALERSVEVRPTANGLNNLATLYFYEGRYEQAADAYEEALALDDRSYVWWSNLAQASRWVAGREDRVRAACQRTIELAQAALDVNRRNFDATLRMAACHVVLGAPDRARTLVRQATEAELEDVQLLLKVADVYEDLGDRDRAVRWLAEAVERGLPPADVERRPGLADLRADPRVAGLLAEGTR